MPFATPSGWRCFACRRSPAPSNSSCRLPRAESREEGERDPRPSRAQAGRQLRLPRFQASRITLETSCEKKEKEKLLLLLLQVQAPLTSNRKLDARQRGRPRLGSRSEPGALARPSREDCMHACMHAPTHACDAAAAAAPRSSRRKQLCLKPHKKGRSMSWPWGGLLLGCLASPATGAPEKAAGHAHVPLQATNLCSCDSE